MANRARTGRAENRGVAVTRCLLPRLALSILVAAAALAGDASHAQDQPVPLFRTRAEVVRVDVLVTAGGRPIADLTADAFELYDSGVRQDAQLTSIDDLEIDVVLALDSSASVRGDLLGALRDAANSLVSALRPGDRAAMITFANAVAIRTPLTEDRTLLGRALESIDAAGSTSLIDATYTGITLMQGNERPTLLLVFSDGVDTSSWLAARPVVSLAARSSLVADAVIVGNQRLRGERRRQSSDAVTTRDEDALRFVVDLTDATGGRVIDGEGGRRLTTAFVDALKIFRTRYQLTYTPTVDQPGYHALEVRVKRPGATVRARPGYTK